MPGSSCCAQSQCGTPTLHAVASRANALGSTIITRIRTAPIITLADVTARPSAVPSDLAARRGVLRWGKSRRRAYWPAEARQQVDH